MKSPSVLQDELNKIIKYIDMYSERVVEAMCNGNGFDEERYEQEIGYLENKKELLEWVLN
ncbi:hypothetical protein JK635_02545 [Neobacillus sp. YIM B02564]|uniref:Uncharacterized protein n=1 Tax=Neobacillus paridis TaxID=2803862 RepID=A0ABS1TMI7_9BACI|nr:hypothetical protein [Neobacillus paridis]MBL4951120.1 hypothetical protein [Neobacillus paridis]